MSGEDGGRLTGKDDGGLGDSKFESYASPSLVTQGRSQRRVCRAMKMSAAVGAETDRRPIRLGSGWVLWPTTGLRTLFGRTGLKPRRFLPGSPNPSLHRRPGDSRDSATPPNVSWSLDHLAQPPHLAPPPRTAGVRSYVQVVREGRPMAAQGGRGAFNPGFRPAFNHGAGDRTTNQRRGGFGRGRGGRVPPASAPVGAPAGQHYHQQPPATGTGGAAPLPQQ